MAEQQMWRQQQVCLCVKRENDDIEKVLNINLHQQWKWVAGAQVLLFTYMHKMTYKMRFSSVWLLLPCWTGLMRVLHGQGYYPILGRFPCAHCFPFAILHLALTVCSFPVSNGTGNRKMLGEMSVVSKFRSRGLNFNSTFFGSRVFCPW